MTASRSPYAGYRFPVEIISHVVWLYYRFPLSLRMVEEMLAMRGIELSHETVRQWVWRWAGVLPEAGGDLTAEQRRPKSVSGPRRREPKVHLHLSRMGCCFGGDPPV